jgi:hypothetical protein
MFCTGQGFYILDSIITNIDAAQFPYVGTARNSSYEEVLVFDDIDEYENQVLFSFNKDANSFLESGLLPVSLTWFYHANEQAILAFDLYSSKLTRYDLAKKKVIKRRNIPNGLNNAPSFAYEYENDVYFIGTLNNSLSANKPYAFFDFYQINPKRLKTKKHQEIDFGIESLLSPLNLQTIAYRNDKLIIYSLHTGSCLMLDHKWDFKDTLSIRPNLALKNSEVYNKMIPEHEAGQYMYKAKELLLKMQNSKINEQNDIRKILFVDDTTLVLSYSATSKSEMELLFYDLKNKKEIHCIKFPDNQHFLSVLQYTYKVSFNKDGVGVLHGRIKEENNRLKHYFNRVKYTPEKQISTDFLENIKLADTSRSLVMSKFSGIMLVDEKYCANCYRDNKVGQGVLVIKETQNVQNLGIVQLIGKKQLHVNGELIFVLPAEFDRLKQTLRLNRVHPVLPISVESSQ